MYLLALSTTGFDQISKFPIFISHNLLKFLSKQYKKHFWSGKTNEPSLKKSWFPIIASENDDQFNLLWKEIWGGNTNYFTNVGFDSGFWGINYTQKLSNSLRYLSKTKGPVTGLILNKNGLVVKPTQVLQIENLGKTKIIQKCSKSKH